MRRRWKLLVLLAIVALAAAAAVVFIRFNDNSSARVSSDRETVVRVGSTQVRIPVGAAAGDGRLNLKVQEPVSDSVLDAAGVVASGDSAAVTLDETRLAGSAEVSFGVPGTWKKSWYPVVVWEDDKGGWRWLPTDTKQTSGGRVAVAQTDHFSSGFLGAFDVGAAAERAGKEIGNFFTGREGVEQPSCDGDSEARSLLAIKSDTGDRVKWCVGMRNGHPVLKVANNLRTLARVDVMKSATVLDAPGWGLSWDRLAEFVGIGLEKFSAGLPDDRDIFLLRPGKTVTIQLPDDEHAGVDVSASGIGFGLSIVIDGAEMYGAVSAAAKLPATNNVDVTWNFLGDGAGAAENWAAATQSCLQQFMDAYTDDFARSLPLEGEIHTALNFAGRCGAEIGKASVKDSGPLGWITTAAYATVASIVETIFSLVEKLPVAIRQVYDGIAEANNWTTDELTYTIVTDPKASDKGSQDVTLGWKTVVTDQAGVTAPLAGMGEVRPRKIDMSERAAPPIEHVKWTSWGGATARGSGKLTRIDHDNGRLVDETRPVSLVASDLGDCHGARAYRHLSWEYEDGSNGGDWEVCPGSGGARSGNGGSTSCKSYLNVSSSEQRKIVAQAMKEVGRPVMATTLNLAVMRVTTQCQGSPDRTVGDILD